MGYRTLDPATEEHIQVYSEVKFKDAELRAEKAREAFDLWRKTPLEYRKELVLKIAERLSEKKSYYSALMTREMGKPIVQSEIEIDKCIRGCRYYVENIDTFLKPKSVPTEASKSYIAYEPLGVLLGIMPWNFPFWQVLRFALPALLAGNTVILKPAPNVPACAIAIEGLFFECGFPQNVFQALFLNDLSTGKLIQSPRISGVSLTGSSRAGSEVAESAGKSLKKCVLELGGSDPFIVLEDADLEKTIPIAVKSRMLNSGQSCIAAKRFIVSEKIFSSFEKKFIESVQSLTVGDPKLRETDMGPLAREDLLVSLMRQVTDSRGQGAKLVLGGERIKRKGFFYQPTILKDVAPGMPAFDQEIFGPVASLVSVKNDEEALMLANKTAYGLGASIWSSNVERAETMARQIEAGSVFVNALVKSDPRLPFGGIKKSGFGRELGLEGVREFVNIKTVWIG